LLFQLKLNFLTQTETTKFYLQPSCKSAV